MSDVAERVKKIVVDHLGVEASKVVENAHRRPGADSSIRSNWSYVRGGIRHRDSDDAAEKIQTIKDAISFIQSQSGK